MFQRNCFFLLQGSVYSQVFPENMTAWQTARRHISHTTNLFFMSLLQ